MSLFYENDGTSSTDTGNITFADATSLVDNISSAVGKVADFGFNVQQRQYDMQSRSQDLQLKTLMGNLGFQTAVVQAESANTIAQIQAKTALAQAQKQATVTGTTGVSPNMLLMILGVFGFMMLNRK